MTKPRYLFLANAMIIASCVANMCAVFAINSLMKTTMIRASPETFSFTQKFSPFYSLSAFVFTVGLMLWYEQPIRQCLKKIHQQKTPSPDLLEKAR